MPTAEQTIEAMYTVAEVAQILGVSPGTVYNETKSKNMKHYRVRGAVRISKQQLRDYLDGNERGADIDPFDDNDDDDFKHLKI